MVFLMGADQENMVILMGVDQENMVIFWELTKKRGVFMGVGVDQETLFFFYWTAVTRLLILVGLHQHEW